MRKLCKILILQALVIGLAACEDDTPETFTATSLKVVHGVVNGPDVHINTSGSNISFSLNPSIGYRESETFTLPANQDRDIVVTSAEDTTQQILITSVNQDVAGIGTLLISGQGENVEATFLQDDIIRFTAKSDSLTGVRFINLSPDSDLVMVRIQGEASAIANNIAYRSASGYIELPSTRDVGTYIFEFTDSEGNVLATSGVLDLLPDRGIFALFRNQSFILMGLSNDGEGGNSLSVVQLNNY